MDRVTYQATKEDLIATPIPEQTRTYKPVSHQQLIEQTLEAIALQGFSITSERYLHAREGKQATGRYQLKYGSDSEMGLEIAWQNSYDKTVSLKFAVGAHVFVCSNGACYGDIGAYKTKHVGQVQTVTPLTIIQYLQTAGEGFEQMLRTKEIMKNREVTRRTCAELIGRLYIEESLINTTQLNCMKSELEKPTFDYGAKGSVWELYNHTTYALRDSHPYGWLTKHIQADEFFNKEFSLQEGSKLYLPS